MSEHDHDVILDAFLERGRITDVLGVVKSGKEATVYCCRAHPESGAEFLAAKVYRSLDDRTFRNDAVYQEGNWRWARENRVTRAFRAKSRFGREVQYAGWIGREWEILTDLFAAGVPVPRPVDSAPGAILMEFFGAGPVAAPPLHSARMGREAAQVLLERLVAAIAAMLRRNVVHGDLSAYNILWDGREERIIDFPQAVDPRSNPSARALLARDVENVVRACGRLGAEADAARIAADLWARFTEATL
jgi:RIO kinase 1